MLRDPRSPLVRLAAPLARSRRERNLAAELESYRQLQFRLGCSPLAGGRTVVVAHAAGLHHHDERRAAWPRLGVSMRP